MRTPSRFAPSRVSRLAALALFTLAAACGGDGGGNEPDVTVTLSPTTVSLFVGETASLSASVSGGSGGSVSFSSSDTQVAMVSSSGTVTAVGVGSATITASVSGASATASVTVSPSSISVTPETLELEVGATGQLTATITGGVGLSATWSSSDESVATVDATGLVTAQGAGTATVTAAVTGQADVEASADVTVTETPPALYLESLETLDGDPLDVDDVSGVFVAHFSVEGPPGMTGTVEIRLDDVLVASEDVTLPAGAPGIGAAPQRLDDLPVSVSTVTTELVNNVPVARNLNDIATLTPGIVVGGTTTPATVRGGGSIPSLNLRNTPMVYLEGVPAGGTVMGQDGQAYNVGNGQFTGRFVYFDQNPVQVESVEIVADPVGTVYSQSAVADAVDFIIRSDLGSPAGIKGYAGPISFSGATATLSDASLVNMTIGNTYADYVGSGLDLKAQWNWDAAEPTYGGDLTYGANFWVGRTTDFGEWARANAGYDPSLLADQGAGIDYSQWVVGMDPFDPALPPVTTGADLAQTAGYTNYLRLDYYDRAGLRGDRVLRDGSGQPLAFGVDLDDPNLSLKVGATYIEDFAINPDPTWSIAGTLDDPVDPDVGGASGPYLNGFDARLLWNYSGVTDQDACVTGTFDGSCGFTRLNSALGLGFKPDFSGGAGEYTASLRGFDLAWNMSNTLMTHFVYDPDPPALGDLAWDPGQLSIGARLEVSYDLTDNLKLTYGAFGNTYDGRDEVYLSNFNVLSRPFDGSFPTSVQLDGALDPVLQAIQGTLPDPPYTPTGTWYPLNGLRWGAKDVGHNLTVRGLDITDIAKPTGTHTSVDWVHGVVGEPKVCLDLGGGCPGVPTSADYTLEALIPGGSAGGDPFDLDWAQLFALVQLGSSVKVAVPVSARVSYSVEDLGGYRRGAATATFDPMMAPLSEGTYDFFWLTKDDEDLGTISNPFQVQITVSKSFLAPSRPGPAQRR